MIINIGRELAAGGRQTGKRLAEELGYRYFDKEIVIEAGRRSGISAEAFERADENCNRFLTGLLSFDRQLFELQSEVILELASGGDCIFVGRCADYILREKECLNVFLRAEQGDRIARLMAGEGIGEDAARDLIRQTDEHRQRYYNFYTGKRWGDSRSYDLCINTSLWGVEGTVELIKLAAKTKNTGKNT